MKVLGHRLIEIRAYWGLNPMKTIRHRVECECGFLVDDLEHANVGMNLYQQHLREVQSEG